MQSAMLMIPLKSRHVSLNLAVEVWLLGYQCLREQNFSTSWKADNDIKVVSTKLFERGCGVNQYVDARSDVRGSINRVFLQMASSVRQRIISLCASIGNAVICYLPINRSIHWGYLLLGEKMKIEA